MQTDAAIDEGEGPPRRALPLAPCGEMASLPRAERRRPVVVPERRDLRPAERYLDWHHDLGRSLR